MSWAEATAAGIAERHKNREASLLTAKTARCGKLSGKVDVAHAGTKVTVNGHVLHRSAAKKQNSPTNEKQEAKESRMPIFKVTS